MLSLSSCLLQKAVQEEESLVRKSSVDLFSTSTKSTDPDPARKVSCWFPSIYPSTTSVHHLLQLQHPIISSPSLSLTHRSDLRVTTPTLTDRHTPCSPIHSSTPLLSDLSEKTLIQLLKGFLSHPPSAVDTHAHTYADSNFTEESCFSWFSFFFSTYPHANNHTCMHTVTCVHAHTYPYLSLFVVT